MTMSLRGKKQLCSFRGGFTSDSSTKRIRARSQVTLFCRTDVQSTGLERWATSLQLSRYPHLTVLRPPKLPKGCRFEQNASFSRHHSWASRIIFAAKHATNGFRRRPASKPCPNKGPLDYLGRCACLEWCVLDDVLVSQKLIGLLCPSRLPPNSFFELRAIARPPHLAALEAGSSEIRAVWEDYGAHLCQQPCNATSTRILTGSSGCSGPQCVQP